MKCQLSSGEDIYLVLNSTYCETCAQYIDCLSCFKVGIDMKDPLRYVCRLC